MSGRFDGKIHMNTLCARTITGVGNTLNYLLQFLPRDATQSAVCLSLLEAS